MATIGRITDAQLTNLIRKKLTEVGYYQNETPAAEPAQIEQPKLQVELTEKEILFLEDILGGVNGDNDEEKGMLFNINSVLKNSLVNR